MCRDGLFEKQTCNISGSCSLIITVSKGAANKRSLFFCLDDTASLPCRRPLYQAMKLGVLKGLRRRGCWGTLGVSVDRDGVNCDVTSDLATDHAIVQQ